MSEQHRREQFRKLAWKYERQAKPFLGEWQVRLYSTKLQRLINENNFHAALQTLLYFRNLIAQKRTV